MQLKITNICSVSYKQAILSTCNTRVIIYLFVTIENLFLCSVEGIMIMSIPAMWLFPNLCQIFLPQPNHKQIFNIPDITIHFFFLFSVQLVGMVGARHAY